MPDRHIGAPDQVGAGRPRLVVVDSFTVTSHLDPYLSLKALAGYSSLSVNTLRSFIDLPPREALPCYRLPSGGKLLVRRSTFDAWLHQYQTRGRPSLTAAMRELGLDRATAGERR